MNENTQELLQSLTRIIKKKSGSLKKVALSSSPFFCLEHWQQAEELEKNFVKITVKSYLLIENEILTVSDFLVAECALLNSVELLTMCY